MQELYGATCCCAALGKHPQQKPVANTHSDRLEGRRLIICSVPDAETSCKAAVLKKALFIAPEHF